VTPDVNILVAASRGDHAHYTVAHEWLGDALLQAQSGRPLRLLPTVIAGFLRLVTNRKVFKQPTPTADAITFIDAMLALPGVDLAASGSEWPALRALCLEKNLTANAIPDAWIAAAVVQLGDHLVTFDKDFRKLLTRSQVTLLAGQSAPALGS
jgi:uncharacterized protein